MDHELEIAWNGSLDRQGIVPSLSSYRGQSTLSSSDTRAAKEVPPALLHDDEKRLAATRKYGHKARKARADQVRAELHASRAQSRAQRARKQVYLKAYYQQQKAVQLSIFEGQA